MRTAIITGASAGLGTEYLRQAMVRYPDIEEYWLIARRESRLHEIAAEYPGKSVVVMPLDLCDQSSFSTFQKALAFRRPDIRLLVNNAGCGYLGNVGEGDCGKQTRMTQLNVTALTAITHMCLAYMQKGARIVNVSSIASFCPNPRMTVYSSTKAFVSSFTRGLREETRSRGISVTAVCPGPMDTEFLTVGGIEGNSPMFAKLPYCNPVEVVEGSLEAAEKGKVFFTPTPFYKFYRVLAKLLPHALVVQFSKT